jgi:hypothetical protein
VFAVGAGAGGLPLIDVYNAQSGAFLRQIDAFETFNGGVRVAVGRFQGQDIVIAAAGPGKFPLVRVFRASDGMQLSQFEAFDEGFSGGVWVAAGDLDGDGNWEIVTGADASPSGFPLLSVHDVSGKPLLSNHPVFEDSFKGGVRVAVIDLNGNGQPQIVVSRGGGSTPQVQIIDGRTFAQVGLPFEVFDHAFGGGVFVTGAVLDSSGLGRIVVGADGANGDPNDVPVLRAFDGQGNIVRNYALALQANYHGGVTVAGTLAFGSSLDTVLAGPARPLRPLVATLDANFKTPPSTFTVLDPRTGFADNANFGNGLDVG